MVDESYEVECDITKKKLKIYKDDLFLEIVLYTGDIDVADLTISLEVLKNHVEIIEKLKKIALEKDANLRITDSKYEYIKESE